MIRFAEILDAASELSVDEQEALLRILRHRIAESNRAQLVADVAEARAEFAAGKAATTSVPQIMDEVSREA
jgi:hypothetical protein